MKKKPRHRGKRSKSRDWKRYNAFRRNKLVLVLPLVERRSPDWFHNFAWDYRVSSVAVSVWAYVAVIAALILKKYVRKPSG